VSQAIVLLEPKYREAASSFLHLDPRLQSSRVEVAPKSFADGRQFVAIVPNRSEVISMPSFEINIHPLGWKCGACGEILTLPIMDQASAATDPDLQAAFRSHDCDRHREETARKSKGHSTGC